MTETPRTFDPPDKAKPDVLIYDEALAAQRNVVALLMRRDRRRQVTQWVIGGYAIAATLAASYGIGSEKVYVYQLVEDHAGRQSMVLLDRTYTLTRGDMVDGVRWWLFHLRTVSLDPVLNDKFAAAAQARVADAARALLEQQRQAAALPAGWTRDVDLASFGATQLSDGEGGFASFLVEWTEREFHQLQERKRHRMLATVTVAIRPPGPMERQAGNLDGLWIAAVDIQPAPGKV